VDKPATDLKYNFYSIQNPKDYLGGSDAVVVETGPYNLRCVVVLLIESFNIPFSSSLLTIPLSYV
jgi:hypothetical protein